MAEPKFDATGFIAINMYNKVYFSNTSTALLPLYYQVLGKLSYFELKYPKKKKTSCQIPLTI